MTRTTITALLLLLGTTASGCDDDTSSGDTGAPQEVDPVALFGDPGEHRVGYSALEHPREDAPALEVKAWYPAEGEPDGSATIEYAVRIKFPGFPSDPLPILGHAHKDAEAKASTGPYPLVVLSHGFSMNPEWYHPLAEHLASHGFVVLAPEHTESDWTTDVVAASVARPADVSSTIDFASTGSLSAIIDTEHVGVIGHSYGGYTSLAVAGARIDPQDLMNRCAEVADPAVTSFFCDPFLGGQEELATLMGLEAIPAGLWPSMADSRVDAIVPMAGDAYLFGQTGLASVEVPAMMLGGTADTGTLWDWGAGLAFDSVSSDTRVLVSLEGAEHFIEVSTCDDMPWTSILPPEFFSYVCEDPAWDKPEALQLINQVTTAFLSQTLRDDPDGEAALDPALYDDIEAFDIEWSE